MHRKPGLCRTWRTVATRALDLAALYAVAAGALWLALAPFGCWGEP